MKTRKKEIVDDTRAFDAKYPHIAALRGRRVECFGDLWTVAGPSYRGSMRIFRTETRPDGKWVVDTYTQLGLPDGHPHKPTFIEPHAPAR